LTYQAKASSLVFDLYMFAVIGEMVVSIATTRVQIETKFIAPHLDVSKDGRRVLHSCLLDNIGQASLPLSFGLANATSTICSYVPVASFYRGTIAKDLVHALAYKVLQMLVFSSIEMLVLDYAPTQVFHLVGKILESKLHMPCLEVAQAITKPFTKEDLAKLQAKLATEAIVVIEEGVLQHTKPSLLFDAPLTIGVAYLVDVVARFT